MRIVRRIERMREVDDRSKLDDCAIGRALEQLSELVKQRGFKSSATRELIARAALSRSGHFSVDELVQDLNKGGSDDVHPATIYRVLPLLVEAGLLQMTLISLGEGARYERAFERDHHDHLICTSCGKVVEFESEAIEVLQRDVAARFRFQLTGHVHELLGVCESCRAQADAAPRGPLGNRRPTPNNRLPTLPPRSPGS